MTGAEGPLVDAHAHAWDASVPYTATAWKRLDYTFPAETLLAWMDASGVGYGVIAAASLFGTYNDYTLDAMRRHKRLRGTAIVDPTISFEALRDMRDVGMTGIRLQWFNLDPLPDLRRLDYRILMKNLRDLDMHVHVNIEGGRYPLLLPALAETGVKIVIDHFGWSDDRLDPGGHGMEAVIRHAQEGKAWVKISSGFNFLDPQIPIDHAARFLREVGTDRLFWASDAPFVNKEHIITYAKAVELFSVWVPNAAQRREIGETAYKFYFA